MGGQDAFYETYDRHGLDPNVFRVEFHENGHLDFTDTTLALTPLGKHLVPSILPLFGKTDAGETLVAQIELTRSFFDIFLKKEEL